jgi:hypothetical protein
VHRPSFVIAARNALDLASTQDVRRAWYDDSSCAGMTVGGLAAHLLGQAVNAVRLIEADPVDEQPLPLLEHYARAAWVQSGPDEEANTSIRDDSNADGLAGPDRVLAAGGEAVDRLPAVLETERSPDQVHIPWQGWSLATHDFLVTRAMEIVVHSDDLAASVGMETPEFPDDVVTDVLALLAGVAVRRHGQTALVRALSRPQRASGDVSAF